MNGAFSEQRVYGLLRLGLPLPLLGAVAVGSWAGNTLGWIHGHVSLGWACVAAIGITTFAGGYAAAEHAASDRATTPEAAQRRATMRSLALALAALTVAILNVLSRYIADAKTAQVVAAVTWSAIPASVVLWANAAYLAAGTIEPARASQSQSRLFGILRGPLDSFERNQPRGRILVLGSAFAVAGVIPGVLWTSTANSSASWRGHDFTPGWHWLYGLYAAWVLLVLVLASLRLTTAYFRREPGPPSAERRAWYFARASVAVVLMVALLGLSSLGLLAAPLIDLALAIYALVFVLLVLDANAEPHQRVVRLSLPRRIVASVFVISVAIGLPAILDLVPFRAGLLAAALGGGLPLLRPLWTGLYGAPRVRIHHERGQRPDSWSPAALPVDDEDRESLFSLLAAAEGSSDVAPRPIPMTVLLECRARLELLDRSIEDAWHGPAPKQPVKHPIRKLVASKGAPEMKGAPGRPRALPKHLRLFIETFPALVGDNDARRTLIVELLRDTAENLLGSEDDPRFPTDPQFAMSTLVAECVLRLPERGDSDRRLKEMRRLWVRGQLDEWTQHPTQDQLDTAELVERSAARRKAERARQSVLAERVGRAGDGLIDAWRRRIENALREAHHRTPQADVAFRSDGSADTTVVSGRS